MIRMSGDGADTLASPDGGDSCASPGGSACDARKRYVAFGYKAGPDGRAVLEVQAEDALPDDFDALEEIRVGSDTERSVAPHERGTRIISESGRWYILADPVDVVRMLVRLAKLCEVYRGREGRRGKCKS